MKCKVSENIVLFLKKKLGVISPSGHWPETNRSRIIDNKLRDFGFYKVDDSWHQVCYDRYDEKNDYCHRLVLTRGRMGVPTVQSVRKVYNSAEGYDGSVTLTVPVLRLALAKIKQKGWEGRIDG